MVIWMLAFVSTFLAVCLSLVLIIYTGAIGFVLFGSFTLFPLFSISFDYFKSQGAK